MTRVMSRSVRVWLPLRLLPALIVLFTSGAPGALAHPGHWTPPSSSWNGTAVHMALLRGDGSPYHSHVIWWQSEGSNSYLVGGQWGWKAATGNADCSSYPDSAMVAIGIPSTTDNLFCSGLTPMADGRLIIVGGTEPGTENGQKIVNIFAPGSGSSAGSWATDVDSMKSPRYYPTATLLADGRVLASSGSQYPQIELFGGTSSTTSAPTDSLLRFGTAFKGNWDPSLGNGSFINWPEAVTGLSGVMSSGYGLEQIFGGRNAWGELTNEVWSCSRDGNETASDYSYSWYPRNPPTGQQRPPKRMDHAAVMRHDDPSEDREMIVIGGLIPTTSGSEVAANDIWMHTQDPITHAWQWKQLPLTNPSQAPSARYGHTAIMDTRHDQILVFGGRPTSGGPSDYTVHALRFSSNSDSVTWFTPVSEYPGVYPDPRYHHFMGMDNVDRKYQDVALGSAILFGGHGTGGTRYNDTWRMWISVTGDTVSWEQISAENAPSGRESQAAYFEGGSNRLFVFGGLTGGAPDTVMRVVDFDNDPPTWRDYAPNRYSLSGSAMILRDLVFSRTPDIYSPSSNAWSGISNSFHLQNWYPQMLLMPNGKVFAAGPAPDSYTLDPDTGTWSEYPPSSPSTYEITGGGAVMYRPGLVMKAGSRDIDTQNSVASTRSSWIDLTAGSPAWADGGDMTFGRVNHNLTILPTGDVIATGGLGFIADDQNVNPKRRPEIWSASTHSWRGGDGADSLAYSQVPRGYHSTAILLPDARVLCAGGNALPGSQDVGDIYCPPYLFNSSGGLATRPTLIATTGRWRYNADVTFAVSGDTAIRSACLIRAGATTHAQDQSQRFVPIVPLTRTVRADGVSQFMAKAPADSFNAPPGDYLLFVLDAAGVPSIARWVRVGPVETGQLDSAAPDSFAINVALVGCASAAIDWLAPGDDGNTGTALDYDIRYSTNPINATNISSATPLSGVGIPMLAGSTQSASVSGLSDCTWYYFGGNVRDGAGNWSLVSTARIKTPCGYCIGDGEAMRESRGASSLGAVPGRPGTSSRTMSRFVAPSELTEANSLLRLVAEFEKGSACSWRLSYQNLAADSALLSATVSRIVIQDPTPSGAWQERTSFDPGGGHVAVRSLARAGRIVFSAGTTLAAVETAPLGFQCTEVVHSRLGPLAIQGGSIDSLSIDAALGDTLELAYAPDSSSAGEDCFFHVSSSSAAMISHNRSLRPQPSPTESAPAKFALYPARPNPFSQVATIRFDLPRDSRVLIEIFDVQGRRVATIRNEAMAPGHHVVTWDGSMDSGRRSPGGVYLCRMTAGAFSAEKRVTLLP